MSNMTIAQLISALKRMPPKAEVAYIWDGAARSSINHVWLTRGGFVVVADYGDVVYDDVDRPKDAPSSAAVPFWQTATRDEVSRPSRWQSFWSGFNSVYDLRLTYLSVCVWAVWL